MPVVPDFEQRDTLPVLTRLRAIEYQLFGLPPDVANFIAWLEQCVRERE